MGFGMPKWSFEVNHLAYADGTIIFFPTNAYSLEMIMFTLQDCEKSGQKGNKDKSFYFMHQSTVRAIGSQVGKITGMTRSTS